VPTGQPGLVGALNIGKNLSPAPRADKRKSPARKKIFSRRRRARRLFTGRRRDCVIHVNSAKHFKRPKIFSRFFMRARAMQNAFHCE